MKILSLRCSALAYSVTTPSKIAIDLDVELIGARRSFADCLLLQIAVEQGDGARVSAAAKAVRRTVRNTRPTQLVINGFAGFAAPDARPDHDTARMLLAELIERLGSHPGAPPVHWAPFGWNKSWNVQVIDGEWQQRVIHI